LDGKLGGTQSRLDDVQKRKISYICQELKPNLSDTCVIKRNELPGARYCPTTELRMLHNLGKEIVCEYLSLWGVKLAAGWNQDEARQRKHKYRHLDGQIGKKEVA
jgi:hypothetical protein